MDRTVYSLLMQLHNELKIKVDLSAELDKMYNQAMAVCDHNTAAIYERQERLLRDEENRLRLAISVIEERVS